MGSTCTTRSTATDSRWPSFTAPWERSTAALPSCCLPVELQGHGHTADVDRPLSYRQLAADATALLEALGIETVDLVGYSLGGAVAMQLAMQHPGMARRVVFAGGTSYRRDGLYPEMLAETEAAADDLTGSVWHQAYVRVAPDPGRWPDLVAKNGELDRTFAGWADEDMQAMTTPMLLIIGDSDIVRPSQPCEPYPAGTLIVVLNLNPGQPAATGTSRRTGRASDESPGLPSAGTGLRQGRVVHSGRGAGVPKNSRIID